MRGFTNSTTYSMPSTDFCHLAWFILFPDLKFAPLSTSQPSISWTFGRNYLFASRPYKTLMNLDQLIPSKLFHRVPVFRMAVATVWLSWMTRMKQKLQVYVVRIYIPCSIILAHLVLTIGYRVAQVRTIFKLHIRDTSHPAHKMPLAYVRWFSRHKPTAEPGTLMYVVSRERAGGVCRGEVIPLSRIQRFVHLVPRFGPVTSDLLTTNNSMDICREYWVNSFADKEIYQAIW